MVTETFIVPANQLTVINREATITPHYNLWGVLHFFVYLHT